MGLSKDLWVTHGPGLGKFKGPVVNSSTSVPGDPWDPGKARQGLQHRASPSYALPSFLPSKTSIIAKKTKADLEDAINYLEREVEKKKKQL